MRPCFKGLAHRAARCSLESGNSQRLLLERSPRKSSFSTSLRERAREIEERGKSVGVKFYQFSWLDLFGVQRSKLVPASRVLEIAEEGAGFAGFAAHVDMDPTMGDLLAVPDPSTLQRLPWKPEVGWLACDLLHEGIELAHGPRNVLRNVQSKLKKDAGLTLKSGIECEFFLLDAALNVDEPRLFDTFDTQVKPCYDAQALMRRYDFISTLCEHMEDMGWGPYQADHEDANGQFEINWDYDDCLVTADRVTFFKYMVRSLAEDFGFRATFMPKPFAHLTGSGCHAHLSLHDAATDRNVCGDSSAAAKANHGLSGTALGFLAGLLAHSPAVAALSNPTVNSYKRLQATTTASGATWSPPAVTWAGNNRTVLVRVPGGAPRMELRLGDCAANPYLLAAAAGAAGLVGLANGSVPPIPADLNMYDHTNPAVEAAVGASGVVLPSNLAEALDALDASDALRSALGDPFVDAYLKLRREHWREYTAHTSPWEISAYLDS